LGDFVGKDAANSSSSSSISSTLLEQIRAQQPEAWKRLICLYGPLVYRWCRQYDVTRDDAPDLVQEVFAAVALHIDRFQHHRPGDSFAAWLRTVTRNVVRGYYRSRRSQPVAQGGTDAQERFLQVPEPAEPTEGSDSHALVRLIMPIGLELVRAEFENHTWEAFRRVAIERQSSARVAVDLGMSIAAVYQAKSRVLRRLRQEFDGLIE
jgi:RNA polymerase sigma-70 factor (ECF subfamily)